MPTACTAVANSAHVRSSSRSAAARKHASSRSGVNGVSTASPLSQRDSKLRDLAPAVSSVAGHSKEMSRSSRAPPHDTCGEGQREHVEVVASTATSDGLSQRKKPRSMVDPHVRPGRRCHEHSHHSHRNHPHDHQRPQLDYPTVAAGAAIGRSPTPNTNTEATDSTTDSTRGEVMLVSGSHTHRPIPPPLRLSLLDNLIHSHYSKDGTRWTASSSGAAPYNAPPPPPTLPSGGQAGHTTLPSVSPYPLVQSNNNSKVAVLPSESNGTTTSDSNAVLLSSLRGAGGNAWLQYMLPSTAAPQVVVPEAAPSAATVEAAHARDSAHSANNSFRVPPRDYDVRSTSVPTDMFCTFASGVVHNGAALSLLTAACSIPVPRVTSSSSGEGRGEGEGKGSTVEGSAVSTASHAPLLPPPPSSMMMVVNLKEMLPFLLSAGRTVGGGRGEDGWQGPMELAYLPVFRLVGAKTFHLSDDDVLQDEVANYALTVDAVHNVASSTIIVLFAEQLFTALPSFPPEVLYVTNPNAEIGATPPASARDYWNSWTRTPARLRAQPYDTIWSVISLKRFAVLMQRWGKSPLGVLETYTAAVTSSTPEPLRRVDPCEYSPLSIHGEAEQSERRQHTPCRPPHPYASPQRSGESSARALAVQDSYFSSIATGPNGGVTSRGVSPERSRTAAAASHVHALCPHPPLPPSPHSSSGPGATSEGQGATGSGGGGGRGRRRRRVVTHPYGDPPAKSPSPPLPLPFPVPHTRHIGLRPRSSRPQGEEVSTVAGHSYCTSSAPPQPYPPTSPVRHVRPARPPLSAASRRGQDVTAAVGQPFVDPYGRPPEVGETPHRYARPTPPLPPTASLTQANTISTTPDVSRKDRTKPLYRRPGTAPTASGTAPSTTTALAGRVGVAVQTEGPVRGSFFTAWRKLCVNEDAGAGAALNATQAEVRDRLLPGSGDGSNNSLPDKGTVTKPYSPPPPSTPVSATPTQPSPPTTNPGDAVVFAEEEVETTATATVRTPPQLARQPPVMRLTESTVAPPFPPYKVSSPHSPAATTDFRYLHVVPATFAPEPPETATAAGPVVSAPTAGEGLMPVTGVTVDTAQTLSSGDVVDGSLHSASTVSQICPPYLREVALMARVAAANPPMHRDMTAAVSAAIASLAANAGPPPTAPPVPPPPVPFVAAPLPSPSMSLVPAVESVEMRSVNAAVAAAVPSSPVRGEGKEGESMISGAGEMGGGLAVVTFAEHGGAQHDVAQDASLRPSSILSKSAMKTTVTVTTLLESQVTSLGGDVDGQCISSSVGDAGSAGGQRDSDCPPQPSPPILEGTVLPLSKTAAPLFDRASPVLSIDSVSTTPTSGGQPDGGETNLRLHLQSLISGGTGENNSAPSHLAPSPSIITAAPAAIDQPAHSGGAVTSPEALKARRYSSPLTAEPPMSEDAQLETAVLPAVGGQELQLPENQIAMAIRLMIRLAGICTIQAAGRGYAERRRLGEFLEQCRRHNQDTINESTIPIIVAEEEEEPRAVVDTALPVPAPEKEAVGAQSVVRVISPDRELLTPNQFTPSYTHPLEFPQPPPLMAFTAIDAKSPTGISPSAQFSPQSSLRRRRASVATVSNKSITLGPPDAFKDTTCFLTSLTDGTQPLSPFSPGRLRGSARTPTDEKAATTRTSTTIDTADMASSRNMPTASFVTDAPLLDNEATIPYGTMGGGGGGDALSSSAVARLRTQRRTGESGCVAFLEPTVASSSQKSVWSSASTASPQAVNAAEVEREVAARATLAQTYLGYLARKQLRTAHADAKEEESLDMLLRNAFTASEVPSQPAMSVSPASPTLSFTSHRSPSAPGGSALPAGLPAPPAAPGTDSDSASTTPRSSIGLERNSFTSRVRVSISEPSGGNLLTHKDSMKLIVRSPLTPAASSSMAKMPLLTYGTAIAATTVTSPVSGGGLPTSSEMPTVDPEFTPSANSMGSGESPVAREDEPSRRATSPPSLQVSISKEFPGGPVASGPRARRSPIPRSPGNSPEVDGLSSSAGMGRPTRRRCSAAVGTTVSPMDGSLFATSGTYNRSVHSINSAASLPFSFSATARSVTVSQPDLFLTYNGHGATVSLDVATPEPWVLDGVDLVDTDADADDEDDENEKNDDEEGEDSDGGSEEPDTSDPDAGSPLDPNTEEEPSCFSGVGRLLAQPTGVKLTKTAAVTMLQRVGRGYLCRRYHHFLFLVSISPIEVAMLQRFAAGYLTRKRFGLLYRASHTAKQELALWERRNKAAIAIQSVVRAFVARQKVKRLQRKLATRLELRIALEIPDTDM